MINLKELKEECKIEMFMPSTEGLELIEIIESQQYMMDKLQEENDKLCKKLADIRDLFDDSDREAEGHGMEDMIADPCAVACYAENKLKRLIGKVKEQQKELSLWHDEFMGI